MRFDADTRDGVRDKLGYDALLKVLGYFEAAKTDAQIRSLLRFLLWKFVGLRNASNVPLARIKRLNLDQLPVLFDSLLQTPSGGLLPVLLTIATFKTVQECYEPDWKDD